SSTARPDSPVWSASRRKTASVPSSGSNNSWKRDAT
ncbi:MAG: hypothetical protein AVDCRST_MAG37-667, partial [uncultured Rubrobacteraceae bacterium]